MAVKVNSILLAITLALVVSLGRQTVYAQTGGQVYFPQTGHYVKNEFLDAYRRVANPQLVYGYPITEAFQDQMTGRVIQYFQRARFELHTEAPQELRVQLSPLGQYLYKPGAELPTPTNFPACRAFPETGFQVCYAFLDFFNTNGGVAQFGYPISNFEYHDDRIVQYFQRSRLEWHPELSSGQRVTLTDLGTEYFTEHGENPIRLAPFIDNPIPQSILNLRVQAFVKNAVTGSDGTQTVYVIVRDQNLQPVAGAQASLVVQMPSGAEKRYIIQPQTDKLGTTQYAFPFSDNEHGLAKIWVTANFEDLKQQTVTSFRIWW